MRTILAGAAAAWFIWLAAMFEAPGVYHNDGQAGGLDGDPGALAVTYAVRMLAEDLDPDAISETVEADRGIGGLVGSRKAKLWDAYVTRWQTKTAAHGNGLVDAFMNYFAEIYERGGRDK